MIRTIALSDGTTMWDELIIFETNAPIELLKELEKVSCQLYANGGIMKIYQTGQKQLMIKDIYLTM